MPIFDSDTEETEFETDEQAAILDEYASLGGDRGKLESEVWDTGRFAAYFRQDRRAALLYVAGKNDDAFLLDALDGIRELTAACDRTGFPVAPEIREREAILRSRLDDERDDLCEPPSERDSPAVGSGASRGARTAQHGDLTRKAIPLTVDGYDVTLLSTYERTGWERRIIFRAP